MISRIKISVLKLLSRINIYILRAKGISCASSCMINMMPYVRKHHGSRIILGEHVTLISNPRHNPLTEHPVSLRTMTSDACIELKDHSGISGANIVCSNKITIGEHTIIGAGTLIYDTDGHTYTPDRGWNTPRLKTGRPINIGNKCFIGTRCIILGGVTIGDNCVVSAGTVLSQDIPPGYKAYGNPAIIEPLPKALGGPDTPQTVAVNTISTGDNTLIASLSISEKQFLTDIQNTLEFSAPLLSLDEEFKNHEEWDSIAFLSLAAYLQTTHQFELTSENFNQFSTLRDIFRKLGL